MRHLLLLLTLTTVACGQHSQAPNLPEASPAPVLAEPAPAARTYSCALRGEEHTTQCFGSGFSRSCFTITVDGYSCSSDLEDDCEAFALPGTSDLVRTNCLALSGPAFRESL